MIKEFKDFISRGNVVDMAVGVIMGSAFGKIVTSLVNDIIMPLVGVLIGGIDFTSLSFKIQKAEVKYGNFIQNIVDFLIVAICIFIFVKIINKLNTIDVLHKKKKEETKKEEVKKSNEEVLLEEIRDLLKKQK
ncbi:MAG: large-conductance mechanosensitive channel protein MscL [Bacilli bacterium]|nr:large-conductance mechanosensitive channel protein MscL [Bacilli bacterium]